MRVGKDNEEKALARPGTRRMEMGGRPMEGYVSFDAATLSAADVTAAVEHALPFVLELPPKAGKTTAEANRRKDNRNDALFTWNSLPMSCRLSRSVSYGIFFSSSKPILSLRFTVVTSSFRSASSRCSSRRSCFAWIYEQAFARRNGSVLSRGLVYGALGAILSWSFTTLAVAAKNVMTSVPDYMVIETAFTVVQWLIVGPLTAFAFGESFRAHESAETADLKV